VEGKAHPAEKDRTFGVVQISTATFLLLMVRRIATQDQTLHAERQAKSVDGTMASINVVVQIMFVIKAFLVCTHFANLRRNRNPLVESKVKTADEVRQLDVVQISTATFTLLIVIIIATQEQTLHVERKAMSVDRMVESTKFVVQIMFAILPVLVYMQVASLRRSRNPPVESKAHSA